MDYILIEGLELDCIVGLRPMERRRPQRVRIDLSLGLEVAAAARSGRIALSCDYDRVTEEVMALLRFREYRLIESATEEIAAMLFGIYPALLTVEIRLDKPTALRGRAYSTGVRVTRRRDQLLAQREETAAGAIERLIESCEAGLYLIHVHPGRSATGPAGFVPRVIDWVVAGDLLRSDVPLHPMHRIGPATVGFGPIRNPGDREAILFCCTCPAWPAR
jgi:FolB domain-containing protein